jgi:hypothetical protein
MLAAALTSYNIVNKPRKMSVLSTEESLDDELRTPEDKRPTLDDRRTREAVIDGFLLVHSAKLEPEGDGWLLRYPLASAHLQEQQLGSFEGTLPIVGETYKDALMIAKLVLRGHNPPEIPTQPAPDLDSTRRPILAERKRHANSFSLNGFPGRIRLQTYANLPG